MQNKHKIVLAIAQELDIELRQIQEKIALFKQIFYINYDFVDDFSFELENDIKIFINKDYLSKKRYIVDLTFEEKTAVEKLKNMINDVFKKTNLIINKEENQILFTIGYEGISIDTYINKLLVKQIKALVDIRRNAYSNKFGFSKNEFKYCLEKSGINYIHIPELGIENEKREEIKKAKTILDLPLFGIISNKNAKDDIFTDYKQNLPTKQKYIDNLLDILNKNKFVAITCFEADAKCCHRYQLANYLQNIIVVNL